MSVRWKKQKRSMDNSSRIYCPFIAREVTSDGRALYKSGKDFLKLRSGKYDIDGHRYSPEQIRQILERGWKCDDSFEEYNGKEGYLRSSKLKTLVDKTPYHFKYEVDEDTFAKSNGRAVHSYILTPDLFSKEYGFLDGKLDKRISKSGIDKKGVMKYTQEDWENARLDMGVDQLLPKDEYDSIVAQGESLLNYRSLNGSRKWDYLWNRRVCVERSFYGSVEGVLCKARPDMIVMLEDGMYNVDVKTSNDLSRPDREIEKWGHHISTYFHKMVVEAVTGNTIDGIILALVSNKPPYMARIVKLSDEWLTNARVDIENELQHLKDYIETGYYPGYEAFSPTGIEELECPGWVSNKVRPSKYW